MTLFRKLSIASVCLTIVGQLAGWGGGDNTVETAAEVGLLLKAFGGTPAPASGGKKGASPADDPADPAAILSALTR